MRPQPRLILSAALLGIGVALVPLAAQGGGRIVLDSLQRGQWTVLSKDGGPARAICLGNPMQLVQLRHAGSAGCSRYVVENEPGRVAIQYTCRGNGYGRTSIRRETDTLVQIESQGVEGGQPFQFHAEARRTGPCR